MSEAVCFGCGGRLIKWGGYWRWLRRRLEVSCVWVPRRRCTGCGKTHGLLPFAALERRLDAVEMVGQAVVGKIRGASAWDFAARLDLPATTIRDWLRRHRERAPELERGLIGWAIERGEQVPWDRPKDVERAAVTALGMAWHAACRRWSGWPAEVWRFWSAITGDAALATNRHPPFAVLQDRRATPYAVPRAP